jgi:hypothetical protein
VCLSHFSNTSLELSYVREIGTRWAGPRQREVIFFDAKLNQNRFVRYRDVSYLRAEGRCDDAVGVTLEPEDF